MKQEKSLAEIIKEAQLSIKEIEKEVGELSAKKDEGDEGFELFMKLKKEGLSEEERTRILKDLYLSKEEE